MPRGEVQELQVQCAVLQALLLLMPLSADAGAAGDSRDPTSALVRTLYPVVRQVGTPHAIPRAILLEICRGSLRYRV